MIYSTNRISSLGIEANPKYYGAGAFNFMQECAKDELDIFENAITTDMNEVILGESSYEMEAINEGFFENVWKKIKELFKKFIEWLKAVTNSAVAKLASLLIRDNKEFAKFAKKRIDNMKNNKKYEWTGTVLKDFKDPTQDVDRLESLKTLITNATKNKNLSTISEDIVKKWQQDLETMESETVSERVEKLTTTQTIGIDEVKKHLDYLSKLSKESIKKVKSDLKKHEDTAKSAIKSAESMERDASSDKFDKEANNFNKENAQLFVTLCNTYKQLAQKQVTMEISLIKSCAKVARTVVAKAAGTTVKEEYEGYDSTLIDAMNEAVLFEYDEALEETSNRSVESEEIDDENFDD